MIDRPWLTNRNGRALGLNKAFSGDGIAQKAGVRTKKRSLPNVSLPSLLTPEQVATITGLALETLAQWRSQKRGLPYLKIGRAVRYDPAEIRAYLERCRVSVSDPRERRRE